jgi:uncharacterized protein (TIGR00255 family)
MRVMTAETIADKPRTDPTDSGLRSMTGQGIGRAHGELGSVTVELRSVNHRGLRFSTRMNELIGALEGRFEQLVRNELKRGSLQAQVRFVPAAGAVAGSINSPLVMAYAEELHRIRETLGSNDPIDLASLLQLPGAIDLGDRGGIEADEVWPLVNEATLIAIDNIDEMRAAEGATMAAVLRDELRSIAGHRDLIAGLAPSVVQQYRDRIESRVQRFIEGRGIEVTQLDLLREVQLFADRADISEELTRLASHLTMFEETMTNTEAAGRKLDFIIQEMFRETNTIGSKAGDARIAASVVEIKCSIERMRELVQNIE